MLILNSNNTNKLVLGMKEIYRHDRHFMGILNLCGFALIFINNKKIEWNEASKQANERDSICHSILCRRKHKYYYDQRPRIKLNRNSFVYGQNETIEAASNSWNNNFFFFFDREVQGHRLECTRQNMTQHGYTIQINIELSNRSFVVLFLSVKMKMFEENESIIISYLSCMKNMEQNIFFVFS